jgi:hypothetical protein
MQPKAIKAGYHLLLALLGLMEMRHSKTPFRKAVCGGWCGFHTVLAWDDWHHPNPEDK